MDTILLLKALLMGIVEGATEFLPVSSTGHLILLGDLINFEAHGNVFEIVIQAGSILAVILLYFQRLWQTFIGLPRDKVAQHFALIVVLGFMPAMVLGYFLHDYIKTVLFSPMVVSFALIGGGIIMLKVENMARTYQVRSLDDMPYSTALKIGFIQCIAMVPGVSRSGATIVGAMLLKVDRKTSAEYSFFLAIPTILAAATYDLYKSRDSLVLDDIGLIAVGFVAAFVSALVFIKAFMAIISRYSFRPSAWYRIILGSIMLLWLLGQGAA